MTDGVRRTPFVEGAQPKGMNLDPSALGLSISDMGRIAQRLDTFEKQYDILNTRIAIDNMRVRPPYELKRLAASDLTTMDAAEYSRTYVEQLGWYSYLTMELSVVRAKLLQASNRMELIEATLKKRYMEQNRMVSGREKLTQEEIRAYIVIDTDYQTETVAHQELKQQQLILEAAVGISEYNLKVISRQVEIRKVEQEAHSSAKNQPVRPRPIGGARLCLYA